MPKDGYTAEGGASGITKWCLGSQIGVPELSPDDLTRRAFGML